MLFEVSRACASEALKYCSCCWLRCDVRHSCGLKVFVMGCDVLDKMCDVLMMVWSEIRIYLLKQSLDHRPKLMMSHLGHPMAAAVVAAPILSECDVVLIWPLVVSCRTRFTSRLVKNLLLLKVKSGPFLEG